MYKEQEDIEAQKEFSQEQTQHEVNAQSEDTQNVDGSATLAGDYEKPQKNNNERFIIFALIAGVVIVSVLVGVGMTLFYPTQNGVASKASTEAQTAEKTLEEEESVDNGEVVIIYGGDENIDEYQNVDEDVNENFSDGVTEAVTTQAARSSDSAVVRSSSHAQSATPQTTRTEARPKPAQKSPSLQAAAPKAPVAQKSASVPPPTVTKPKQSTEGFVKPNISPITKKPIPVASDAQKLYWVQVFSTSNRNKAYSIKGEFEKRGITTVVVTKTINNQMYYRLRIGPYYNKSEGDKFLQWVKKIDVYKDAYLTTNYI